jgi:8-amino-7-oxononanoate synthase
LCADTLANVQIARGADASRRHLAELAELARSELARARVGLVPNAFGPIVSVLAGPSARALEAAQALRDVGILAQPIRPPTVPEGLARLRLTLSANWSQADIRRLVTAVGRVLGEP